MIRYLLLTLSFSLAWPAFSATLQDLSALHGCWRGNAQGGVLQESWTKPMGGMMFGTDMIIDANGKSLGWGNMVLSSSTSGVQFGYGESGAAIEYFDLKKFSGTGGEIAVTFANSSKSGPNEVVLTVTGNRSLRIQLFGNGGPSGLDLTIDRVSDTAECP